MQKFTISFHFIFIPTLSCTINTDDPVYLYIEYWHVKNKEFFVLNADFDYIHICITLCLRTNTRSFIKKQDLKLSTNRDHLTLHPSRLTCHRLCFSTWHVAYLTMVLIPTAIRARAPDVRKETIPKCVVAPQWSSCSSIITHIVCRPYPYKIILLFCAF